MFAAVDLMGKKSMSMSTIDKTDLNENTDKKGTCVYEKDIHISHKGQDTATIREKGQGITRTRAIAAPCKNGLFISSVKCCPATKPSSLVMFAAVDLMGKKSMSMSTIDKTDLITKSIFDTFTPISVLASPFLQGAAIAI
jgi:hypothetical protein